ncbi:substrate-binding periplasmic protein [Ancylobacter terrae]|uniref:substrate-binding periplasmic protein n=1 Tax=Ancylobacter sp. sgz301288 TaxID=3342077 RepID=UPI00385E6600
MSTISRMPGLAVSILALVVSGSLGALGAAGPAAADALDGIKSSKKFVVCGVDGMLPYSSSDAKIAGFEVEIARQLAGHLGATAEYSWVTWDALIPALMSKRCDAIVDGMFITKEREKVIRFSTPYYASGQTILVRKDDTSVKGLEDLKDKKVGVLAGSVTVNTLEKKGLGKLEVYPDQNTIIIELNNNRIDAAFLEAPTAAWAIANDPSLNIRIVEEFVPDERFNAGVGLRPDDAALKKAVDAAILKMREDGSIKKILEGYKVPYFPIAN